MGKKAFESIKRGLEQAIAHHRGEKNGTIVRRVAMEPDLGTTEKPRDELEELFEERGELEEVRALARKKIEAYDLTQATASKKPLRRP